MANANANDSLIITFRPTASHPISLPTEASDSSRRLDVSRLDQRPPLLDLGLVKCTQRLRRLLFARRNHVTQLRESLPHREIAERIHDRGVEPGDDRLGGGLRDPQAVP